MRLMMLISSFIMAGSCYAQAPINEVNKVNQKKSEIKQKSEHLAHIESSKPEANQVKVIIKKDQIVEEYRHKGELIMVKVIPSDGVPYYLDPQAKNKRTGAHSDLINSGIEPVYWVIKRF